MNPTDTIPEVAAEHFRQLAFAKALSSHYQARIAEIEADLKVQTLRAEKAETLLAVFLSKLPADQRANEVAEEHMALAEKLIADRDQLEGRVRKAEAEVVEWLVLAKQYGYSKPGEVLTELRERSAGIDTLQLQLTTLQQDVRSLVYTINNGTLSAMELALETFLAKHPEYKL